MFQVRVGGWRLAGSLTAVLALSACAPGGAGSGLGAPTSPPPATHATQEPELGELMCGAPQHETFSDGFVDDGDGPQTPEAALRSLIRNRRFDVQLEDFERVDDAESGWVTWLYAPEEEALALFEMIRLDRGSWMVQRDAWCDSVHDLFRYPGDPD